MKKQIIIAAALVALLGGSANAQYMGRPFMGGYGGMGGGYGGNPYANVQRWGQQMGLQQKQFDFGTDCTDYGYGDCAERMARSGNPQGPGWMITGGGGYGGGYRPNYGGGYGQGFPQGGGWGGGGGQFHYQQQWGGSYYQPPGPPRIIGWRVCDPYGRCWIEGAQ